MADRARSLLQVTLLLTAGGLLACAPAVVVIAAGSSGGGGGGGTDDVPADVTQAPPPFTNQESVEVRFRAAGGLQRSFEGQLDGGPWTAITSPHRIQAAAPGSHRYRVRVKGSTATPVTVNWFRDVNAPTAPDGVVTQRDLAGSVRLSWNPAVDGESGIDGYRVYYDFDGPGAPYQGQGAAEGSSPVFVPGRVDFRLTALSPCQLLNLAVAAVDRAGNESPLSADANGRVSCGGDGTFAAPAMIRNAFGTTYCVTGDFNNDRIPDVAMTQFGPSSESYVAIALGQGQNGRGNGQFLLQPPQVTGADDVGTLATGDFNADGLLDVAATLPQSQQVSVLLQNGTNGIGDGTFRVAARFAAGAFPFWIVSADLNRDGTPDFVTSDVNGATVTVLLGNRSASGRANGTFGLPTSFPSGNGPVIGLALADFNGDQLLDVALTCLTADGVAVLRGNGNGGLGPPSPLIPAGDAPWALATADYNADGITDLAVTAVDDNVVDILLGNGTNGRADGTFRAGPRYPTGDRPYGILATDLDDDGIVDLATADHASGTVTLLFGNGAGGRGDGTFRRLQLTDTSRAGSSLVAADFDGNGTLDLAVNDSVRSAVVVLPQNGARGRANGDFTLRAAYDLGIGAYSVTAVDLNRDHVLDLAAAVFDSQRTLSLGILLGEGRDGQGTGSFPTFSTTGPGSTGVAVVPGDFDADRIPDLALAGYADAQIRIWLGNGSGGRGDGTLRPGATLATAAGPRSLALGDFNADHITDLVVTHDGATTVGLFLGQGVAGRGSGLFFPRTDLVVPVSSAFAIACADLDGDGILDLAMAQRTAQQICVLRGLGTGGRGNGTFDTGSPLVFPLAGGRQPASVAIVDFNDDRILDLVVTAVEGSSTGAVLVMTGGGSAGAWNRTYSTAIRVSLPGQPFDAAAADLNGDGVLDVAVSDETLTTPGFLRLLFAGATSGRWNGQFAAPIDISLPTRTLRVLPMDANADGITDLVASGGRVSVLLGRGTFP